MKICIIGNPNSIHILRWIEHFYSRGYQVFLIGEHRPTKKLPTCSGFYDLTKHLNIRKFRYLIWAWAIRRLSQQIRPDVLHAHGVASAGWLGAASGQHPYLLTAHGSDLLLLDQRSRLHRLTSTWALQQADYITCVSQILTQRALDIGIKQSKIEVAPIGIDHQIFHPASNSTEVRNQLGLPGGPVVISIRAIAPLYRPLIIAQAIPLVLEKVPDTYFLIFTFNANPDVLQQFKNLVENAGISKSISYIPELSSDQDIAAYYSVADVAISVPFSDSTPISVLEAMACQVALVLSDLPSLHEWVSHEKEGLYVPPDNSQSLASSIVRLLTDQKLRLSLAKNAAQVSRERANKHILLKRYETIYNCLADGHIPEQETTIL